MKMIVALRLKRNSYIFPKQFLMFCETEPPKKSFLYFRREISIFWEKTSDILGNESSSRKLIKLLYFF